MQTYFLRIEQKKKLLSIKIYFKKVNLNGIQKNNQFKVEIKISHEIIP